MITFKAHPSRCFSPIIGEISLSHRPFWKRKDIIFVTSLINKYCLGYKACITSSKKGNFFYPDHIYDFHNIKHLHEGDIVRIDGKGNIHILWETESTHNVFLLTEACNCKCIMCPQPVQHHNSVLLHEANQVLNLLKHRRIEQMCITGGEPTLLNDNFIQFLRKCIQEHPLAHIDILTNGKSFSNQEFTKKVAQVATNNVCFCVSLHSEIDTLHDYLAGTDGSFLATQHGLYNLAEYGCKIEIRHVVNKINAIRLRSFAEHMYNYFPFCVHYVFMGMELYGNAAYNKNIIDISPKEYKNELRDAVLYLHRRGLPVSIYNIPLCLCDPKVRKFACQSISSWKNTYMDICNECNVKMKCAGFFSTSMSLPSNHIEPIKEDL